jgi:hypothetical protein
MKDQNGDDEGEFSHTMNQKLFEHPCSKCDQPFVTLYFVEERLLCYYCLPFDWLDERRAWKLIKRSIKTSGKSHEQMESFIEKIQRKLLPVESRSNRKRRIFKKPAAYLPAVAVFEDGEHLTPSDVIRRLPDLSERSVKSYLKDAVISGALRKSGRGLYQRVPKVQKTRL